MTSRSPDEIRGIPPSRVLDAAEPVLSAVEGLYPGYFAYGSLRFPDSPFRRFGGSAGLTEGQHRLSRGQKQAIAVAARQELDLRVALALVGFEAQRQVAVGRLQGGLGGSIGLRGRQGSRCLPPTLQCAGGCRDPHSNRQYPCPVPPTHRFHRHLLFLRCRGLPTPNRLPSFSLQSQENFSPWWAPLLTTNAKQIVSYSTLPPSLPQPAKPTIASL